MALLVEVKGLMQKPGFFLEVKHRTPGIHAFIFIKTPFVYTKRMKGVHTLVFEFRSLDLFSLNYYKPWNLLLATLWYHKKQRHHFANKGLYSQSYGFSSNHVRMWELDHKKSWALKNWCCWTVVLEKTLKSPLDSKIKLVNPKGNHWLNGHEFEKTPGDNEEQGSLACCSPWGCKQMNTIEWLHNSNKAHLNVSLHKYFSNISIWTTWWYWVKIFKIKQSRETR